MATMGQFIWDYWEFAHKEPIIGMFMFFGMLSFLSFIISRTIHCIESFGPAGHRPIVECSCSCHNEDEDEEEGEEEE